MTFLERLRALAWFLLAAAWFLFSDFAATRAAVQFAQAHRPSVAVASTPFTL